MPQLDFSKQAEPVAAASPAALDFSGNAEPVDDGLHLYVDPRATAALPTQTLPVDMVQAPAMPQATAAGEGIQGSLVRGVSALPFIAGGVQNLLGAREGGDQNFAIFDQAKALADRLDADAQARSKAGAVAGGVLGILPQALAPETLALNAVSHGTNLGAEALQKGKSVGTAEGLLGVGTGAAAVQNALPASLGGNIIARMLAGGAIAGGTGAAEQAAEHQIAPDVVANPTLDSTVTNAGIGAVLAAILGHGTTARTRTPEEALVADPVPQGLPRGADYSAKAEPVRPVAPDLGGAVRVSPSGEAVTPQQGASAFTQAVQAGMAPQPARLPAPVVAVDRAGNAATNADTNAAQAAQQQAIADRQALGITPDIERSQGVRWSQREQQVREETARRDRLGELDNAIATREAQGKPARGINAKPDESVDDALTFLAKSGGLDRRTFVKEGVDPAVARSPQNRTRGGASRPLFRAQDGGGLSLDDATRILWQHGYIPEHDNHQALDLIMEGVNQDKATHSIHRQDQGDLLALEQARRDAADHQVPDYTDVPFSRKPATGETIKKIADFKTDEGSFSHYDTESSPRGRAAMFTVHKSRDGYVVRNALLPEAMQRQGKGSEFYRQMNADSMAKTGKPLRSTPARVLSNGERVHELSPAGVALWDSFVRSGEAEKLGDRDYRFKPTDARFSFAGERAQTADRVALAQAQQMEAMGRDSVPDRYGNHPGSPEDTHIATGWHRGVDGKWKFEIDDSQAVVDADGLRIDRQRGTASKLGDVFHHPELMAAYPDLANTQVRINPEMKGLGAYNAGSNRIDIRPPSEYQPSGDGSLKSVMLHEIQHAIQNHEGFARGGNATEARTLPEFEDSLRQHMDAHGGEMPAWESVKPDHPAAVKAARAVYQRLAGEVEARNTQRRMKLDAGERRATPPSETADTPRSQQIVRFNGGDAHDAGEPHADQPIIDKYNRVLSKYIGADVRLSPAAHVPDAEAAALAGIDQLLGGQSHVIDNHNRQAIDFDGVTLQDGHRLIDSNATAPLVTVTLHETFHHIEATDPALAAEIHDYVREHGKVQDYGAVLRDRATANGEDPSRLSDDRVVSELSADAWADAMSDPDFIEGMAQRNPSLFRKVANAIMASLDRVLKHLRRTLGSSAYLDDVAAFRAKMADVLERYASKQHGGSKGMATDPAFQRVFHGTPHTVDKFSLQKIGTGEGAQAYGWGMYFASERAIADHYRKGLTERDFINKARDAYDEHDSPSDAEQALLGIDGLSESQKELIVALKNDDWLGFDYPHQAISAALKEPQNFELSPATEAALAKQGNLYHVEVPEDHDLLDWDKPLSEQPAKVREALQPSIDAEATRVAGKYGGSVESQTAAIMKMTGAEWYAEVSVENGPKAASEALNAAGIPGLRYLDSTSRAKGEGSANYVIWDENAIGAPEAALSRKPVADQADTPADEPLSPVFSRKPSDTEHLEDMPSRRPGESQNAYLRRITRKNGEDIKAATSLAKNQRKLGRYALRGMMATQARQMAIADAAMNEARKTFDKTPDVINYASVHEWETGQQIVDPDFRHFVETMQTGFDQRIAEIQRMAPGTLESLIENYMPHLYEDSGKAMKWYQNVLGKRPLAGDKSFLKQREWPTLKDAMASGLKPISPNPVDWVLMKYAQMDKFIGLLKLKEDFQRRGWLMKLDPGQRVPEGFAAVDDPAFRIAGGLQGQFVVPELIAKDINNYLTPGLSKYGAWRTLRGMQNAVVSWNLGWSAFHAGFTSVDNAVTHGAVGLQRLADGDIAGGLMALVKSVPTMLTSPFEGAKLNKQWTGQAQTDVHVAALLDLLEQGGARMKMGNASAEYNNALPQVMRTIRRLQAPGAIPDALDRLHRQVVAKGARGVAEAGWGALKGAGRALSAVGEVGSFLIHHVLVPNQKMAARVTLLKFELDRYAKRLGKQRGDYAGIIDVMHPDVAKQLASDVVDKVDFRLGQMTYDNFFYPKILREISQMLVMAPGWQAGAFQTMTGGLKDLGRFAKPEKLVAPLDKAGTIHDAHRGRFTNNVANLAMLFLMVGGGNALYQWLVSGIQPDSMKDLVGPRTGRKNADDSDERIVPPSYMKDHYEFFHHPVAMASHKLHPMLRMMWEISHNEDYFGNMIRDPHHPLGKQALELAGYLGKSMLPFTATNAAKVSANGGGLAQHAANFVGITPAAASLARSEFQAFVAKGGQRGWDYPAATPAEAEYQDRMRKADNAIRTGQQPDLTGLTPHDVAKLHKRTMTFKPELQFDRLSLEDKLDAYELATPEERRRYHLTEVLRGTRPQRSVTFRRLPAEEQRAILTRLEAIARGH